MEGFTEKLISSLIKHHRYETLEAIWPKLDRLLGSRIIIMPAISAEEVLRNCKKNPLHLNEIILIKQAKDHWEFVGQDSNGDWVMGGIRPTLHSPLFQYSITGSNSQEEIVDLARRLLNRPQQSPIKQQLYLSYYNNRDLNEGYFRFLFDEVLIDKKFRNEFDILKVKRLLIDALIHALTDDKEETINMMLDEFSKLGYSFLDLPYADQVELISTVISNDRPINKAQMLVKLQLKKETVVSALSDNLTNVAWRAKESISLINQLGYFKEVFDSFHQHLSDSAPHYDDIIVTQQIAHHIYEQYDEDLFEHYRKQLIEMCSLLFQHSFNDHDSTTLVKMEIENLIRSLEEIDGKLFSEICSSNMEPDKLLGFLSGNKFDENTWNTITNTVFTRGESQTSDDFLSYFKLINENNIIRIVLHSEYLHFLKSLFQNLRDQGLIDKKFVTSQIKRFENAKNSLRDKGEFKSFYQIHMNQINSMNQIILGFIIIAVECNFLDDIADTFKSVLMDKRFCPKNFVDDVLTKLIEKEGLSEQLARIILLYYAKNCSPKITNDVIQKIKIHVDITKIMKSFNESKRFHPFILSSNGIFKRNHPGSNQEHLLSWKSPRNSG